MKLKKLIKDLPLKQFKGAKDIEITGICANSKLVAPGNLFIAKKGKSEDGAHYIPEAVAAGAAAILTDIYDPSLKTVAQLIHPQVGSIEGLVAASYYQFPSRDLFMVGITGTNGKTTTTFLVKHFLDRLRGPCGLIGTIEYVIGQHRYQATRTTPDVTSNHKMLREMLIQGCQSAAMEVTSHALDQGRVENIEYDVAVFTNLTLDHLDYHSTMENYCAAKNKLFRSMKKHPKKSNFPKKLAIINADSPWTQKIIDGCPVPVMTYGLEAEADLRAVDVRLTSAGTEFQFVYRGEKFPCVFPLIGRFNVYNCLAATAVAIAQGTPLEGIIPLMATIPSVLGRLQPVPNRQGLKIYVDFAHSDDALANVLECLKELKKGKIITVFGCGGDRDRSKRPKMARVAEEYSDIAIVTSDNPRNEEPEKIAQEVAAGFQYPERHFIEVDRRMAIRKALQLATPEDIVLIAGKGHETYQIFSHKKIEFDDAKVAGQLCQELHQENMAHL